MAETIFVRLRDSGQVYTYPRPGMNLKENDYVIVEHDRGLDYGQIVPRATCGCSASSGGEGGKENGHIPQHQKTPLKRILRPASPHDLRQIEDNRARAREAFSACAGKIQEHRLDMKLVRAEYSFDRSKIVFYFTAKERVDFRNLVKDLAKIFKARIDLRQIGVRDEARLFGGYGSCGRELCCSRFLKDFEPVSIKMAKEEGLPLNPPKISGLCGRLMCCLSYEYEIYRSLAKGLPRKGDRVSTPQGKGRVIDVNVFKRDVSVQLEDGVLVRVSYRENQAKDEGRG